MPPTRLVYEDHFAQYMREAESAAAAALQETAELTAEAARSASPVGGYRIQNILQSVKAGRVFRARGGLTVYITAGDFRHLFFELGTYRNRRRKLVQGRRSSSASMGVKPGYYLHRAAKLARVVLAERLQAEWGHVGRRR